MERGAKDLSRSLALDPVQWLQWPELTTPTPTAAIASALENLAELDIVHEVPGQRRPKVYVYRELLAILSEGTEPLDPEGESTVQSTGRTEAPA